MSFMNYKFTGFSPKANSVINYAIAQASALGHSYIGSEHLLLGLIKESGGMAGMLLRQRGVSEEEVREKLVEDGWQGSPLQSHAGRFYTPGQKRS